MSSSHRRFYSLQPISPNSQHVLEGSEHQHLAKVLRARVGDQVMLFDGKGSEFEATVESIGRGSTELLVGAECSVDRELAFQLSLAVALPKGDRQQWLVEKLVELGVSRLIPLETEYGVAQPGEKATRRIARWIIAASKQCGRNRLMQIAPPTKLETLFNAHRHASTLVAHVDDAVDIHTAISAARRAARTRCL